MADWNFGLDVQIDGEPYKAARGQMGERAGAIQYVPKVARERIDVFNNIATLNPLNYTTFHRGGGASRVVAPGMHAYGENIWPCDAGVVLPGPEVATLTITGLGGAPSLPVRPDGVAEQDGFVFVASGPNVFKIPLDGINSPTVDLTLATGNALALRKFGTSLFASVSTGNVNERPTGGGWTNALLGTGNVPLDGALGTVYWSAGSPAVTAQRLVAQVGLTTLRYTSGPVRLDTSWTPGWTSGAIDIGNTIQRFVQTQDHVYVATTAGLHDLDSSGLAPNLTPEIEQQGDLPNNGLATLAADGWVYISGGYDLYRVRVVGTLDYATVQTVTPGVGLPNETPVTGYGTALVKRGMWLIYCQYDPSSNTSRISWGREAASDEPGPVTWNMSPIVVHGWKVTAMLVTGLAFDGPRLLLFGVDSLGIVSCRWAPLAFTTPVADLLAGRGRRFATTCFMVLPAEDKGDDLLPADVEEVAIEAQNLGAGSTVTLSALGDGDVVYTQLGKFTGGPRQTIQVGNVFVAQRPTFRIDMAGSPLSPPIQRRITVEWLPQPALREIRTYQFLLGRAERSPSGARVATDPDVQTRHILNLPKSGRVSFVDESRTALTVRVISLDGPNESQGSASDEVELSMKVVMAIYGRTGPAFGYDSTQPYDSIYAWS